MCVTGASRVLSQQSDYPPEGAMGGSSPFWGWGDNKTAKRRLNNAIALSGEIRVRIIRVFLNNFISGSCSPTDAGRYSPKFGTAYLRLV